MTPEMLALLKREEGCRLLPYRDVNGNLTIGYGHNLDARGIPQGVAEELLLGDLAQVEGALEELAWWTGLDPVRRDVVTNMAFNLGLGGMLGFKDMIAALKAGDFAGAAKAMLDSDWARQLPARAQALAAIMESGTFP